MKNNLEEFRKRLSTPTRAALIVNTPSVTIRYPGKGSLEISLENFYGPVCFTKEAACESLFSLVEKSVEHARTVALGSLMCHETTLDNMPGYIANLTFAYD